MSQSDINNARHLLLDNGWLATTSTDFRAAVLEQCIWHRVDADVAITHGGDQQGGIIGLIAGAVSIISAIGPSDTPVAHIARGPFWFGERPALGNRSRTITVVSRTTCDYVLVPQQSVTRIMADNPAWWRDLASLSLDGVTLLTQIATDLLIANAQRRCVAVLLRVAGCRTTGDERCDAGVGQDELAAMANMSRQTIGTILRRLQAEGALDLGYRSIAVVKPAQLRAIVDV